MVHVGRRASRFSLLGNSFLQPVFEFSLARNDDNSTLQDWDVECAGKHLEAIKDSVATHDDLYSFTLMKGEDTVQVLDLAGLENAPGVFDDVSQRCRVAFTNKNRLVFTQVRVCAVFRVVFVAIISKSLPTLLLERGTRPWRKART